MKTAKRIITKILVFSIIVLLTSFGWPQKSVLAQTFNPAFGMTLSDNIPEANSNVTIITTQLAGDEFLDRATFRVPAGWDINSGTNIANGTVIASGSLDFFYQGNPQTFNFTFENQSDTQGHKALWRFVMPDPFCCLFTNVDGTKEAGYSFTIDPSLPAETPLNFTINFLGSVGEVPVFTNPTTAGDYTWSADYVWSGGTVSRSQTLTIPGSVTPTGSDVSVPLGNDVSITFDSVATEGVTSIATSPTAPPDSTGQFQLVPGGLYYDFNTTATISCPCTITLSYDPETTSNPRVYHLVGGVWQDATTSVDSINHTVTGVVSSLSWFAVGTPNFSVDWRLPLEWPNGHESVFSRRIQILPIIFSLLDSNGQYTERNDVTVQVFNSTGQVVAEFPPRYILRDGKFYIAMLKVRQLNLQAGKYTTKVKVGNTLVSPSINFILR